MAWDALRELLTLHERAARARATDRPGWVPPVDLYETTEAYVLQLEVPGVPRYALQISARDSRVTVSGRRSPTDGSPARYHRLERPNGSFLRTFEFERRVDGESIQADLRQGVLTITVPKAANQGPQRVQIS